MTLKKDNSSGVLYRQWDTYAPQAIILLVHGLGAHCGRWESLAEYFLKNELGVFAIELRGFGETSELKGHIDSFDIYLKDIETICSLIKKKYPDKKIFILGESLGGLLAFMTATVQFQYYSGLICISPAFKSSLKFSLFDYMKIFLAYIYNPRKQFVMPFNPQMCTRDTHYQEIMLQDEREHQWATPQLLINTLKAQFQIRKVKKKLSIPTLFLLSLKDFLVNPAVSLKVFHSLKIKDKTVLEYPNMYHCLSIDWDKTKVFQDIVKWIQDRIET